MCELCWDADQAINEGVSAHEKPFVITFDQLKDVVLEKWIQTGKRNFRIKKCAIYNPPSESYQWEAFHVGNKGSSMKKANLSLNFV